MGSWQLAVGSRQLAKPVGSKNAWTVATRLVEKQKSE
jgi:hypothetical protein